ncbi:helix-turn-helix transcriptional regulator [Roseibium sp. TrichSKD4]|uniref:helix-turn-helix transcriptional regulator n=1 Tax=Roseibium sp. TrichSKD4 TaxID=744980 RepID=UPI00058D47B8|nr:helix-turn-helix transcriptional regulator [Roseibium sp. TrichSKD4]
MRYGEFQTILGECGLTIRAFAELVGMNPNSISNYARKGEVPAHLALIAALMKEVRVLGGDYKTIIKGVGIIPKRPRGGAREGIFGGDRQESLDFES